MRKASFTLTAGLVVILLIAFSACGKGGGGGGAKVPVIRPDGPRIDRIEPSVAQRGDQVTIFGANFGVAQGQSRVELRGATVATAPVISWGNSVIVVVIPPNAPEGEVSVVVVRGDGLESPITPSARIVVGQPTGVSPPVIISIDPNFGKVGDVVSIVGFNFGNTPTGNRVTFQGATPDQRIPAEIFGNFWTDTEIKVRVPVGARTGEVRVEVGALTSNPVFFQVQASVEVEGPVIDEVSAVEVDPNTGEPLFNPDGTPVLSGRAEGFPKGSTLPNAPPGGTLVSIRGSGFGLVKGNSVVTFNGRFGRVVATDYFATFGNNGWSNTQILVRVPEDAVSGPIQVRVGTKESLPGESSFFRVIRPPLVVGIQPGAIRFGSRFEIFGHDFGLQPGTLVFTSVGISNRVTELSGDVITSWSDGHIVIDALPVIDLAIGEGGTTSDQGFLVVRTAEGFESNPVDFTIGQATFPVILTANPISGVATDPADPLKATRFTFTVQILDENPPFTVELIPKDGVPPIVQTVNEVNPTVTFENVVFPTITQRLEQVLPQVRVTNANDAVAIATTPVLLTIVRHDVALVRRVEVIAENWFDMSSGGTVSGSFQIVDRDDRIPFNTRPEVQNAYPLGVDPPAAVGLGLSLPDTENSDFQRDPDRDFRLLPLPVVGASIGGTPLLPGPTGDFIFGYGFNLFSVKYPDDGGNLGGPGHIQAQTDLNALGFTAPDDFTRDNSYGGLRIDPKGNLFFRRNVPATLVTNGSVVDFAYSTQEPGLVADYTQGANIGTAGEMPWEGGNVFQSGPDRFGLPIRPGLSGVIRPPGATIGRPMIHPGDRVRIYGINLGTESDGKTGRIVFHVDQNPDQRQNLGSIGAVEVFEDGTTSISDFNVTIHKWGGTAQIGGETLEYVEFTLPRFTPPNAVLGPTLFPPQKERNMSGLVRIDQDKDGEAGVTNIAVQFAPRVIDVKYSPDGTNFTSINETTQIPWEGAIIRLTVFDLFPPNFSPDQEVLANVGSKLAIGFDDGFGYFQWYELTPSNILISEGPLGEAILEFSWDINSNPAILPMVSPIFANNGAQFLPPPCIAFTQWCVLTLSLQGEQQSFIRPGGVVDWIAHDGDNTATQVRYRVALWSGMSDDVSNTIDSPRLVPQTPDEVESGIIGLPVKLSIAAPSGP